MTEIADRYRRLSAAVAATLERVPADGWTAATPCEEWTVRDLVGHLVDTQGMFLGFVGRRPTDLPSVEHDPVAAFAAATGAVQADLDDPSRAATEFDGFTGRTTFEQSVDRFLCFDLVVHGWDLGRATGQDEHLAPDDIVRVSAFAASMSESLRTSGVCGPALDPPDGADEQTQLLALLGRRAWA